MLSNEIFFPLKATSLAGMCFLTIGYYLMVDNVFMCKFQKYSFIKSTVSRKNVKRTFLSPEPFPDDFSKTLFYGDMVNNSICLCVEFHGLQLSSFWSVESQRNRRSGHITASLATFFPLNNLEIFFILIYLIISFLALGFWETH